MDDDPGEPDGSDDADEKEPAGGASDGHGGPDDGPAASGGGPDGTDDGPPGEGGEPSDGSDREPTDDGDDGPTDDGDDGPTDDERPTDDGDEGAVDDGGESTADGDEPAAGRDETAAGGGEADADGDDGAVEGEDGDGSDGDGDDSDGDAEGEDGDGSDGDAEGEDGDGGSGDGDGEVSQADIGLSTSHPKLDEMRGELDETADGTTGEGTEIDEGAVAGTGSGTADDAEPPGAAGDLEMYPYETGTSTADADTGFETGLDHEGPDEDREMPLTDHVEEMLKRLAVVVAIAGTVSLVTFPFAEEIINFLWNSILPAGEFTRPRLYGILELLFTKLRVASLAGLIIALPVLVYETYQFMRPGLYPHERRYYLAAIPTSLVLALVGVSFAYFVILPAIFTYFLYYSRDVATIGFALGRTFDLILLLMGYMALVFQIPLFIMLAMMMGLVTRQWLADRRLLFWGAFLGISFIFSPDPTGMAPIIVALTMVALFEGTLALVKWTGRG